MRYRDVPKTKLAQNVFTVSWLEFPGRCEKERDQSRFKKKIENI